MLKCPKDEKHGQFCRRETWVSSTIAFYNRAERLEHSGEIEDGPAEHGPFKCAICNAIAEEV